MPTGKALSTSVMGWSYLRRCPIRLKKLGKNWSYRLPGAELKRRRKTTRTYVEERRMTSCEGIGDVVESNHIRFSYCNVSFYEMTRRANLGDFVVEPCQL